MIKDYFIKKLDDSPTLYKIAKSIYRLLTPYKMYKNYKNEKIRKEYYQAFEKGEKIVTGSFGGINVKYEAFSPKNYWHLSIGRDEDDFAITLFNEYISDGMVILDIGGHAGMYTVPFAIAVGNTGKVYVVEPEKQGFETIQRNIQLNELGNVIPLNMAVSNEKSIVEFYIRPDKDTHSLFQETTAPSPLGIQNVIQIKTSTIDDMVKDNIIEQPDFVKIDTEGAELKILDGINNSAENIMHILVEIHEIELKLNGIVNPKKTVEQKLQLLGFNNHRYLDGHHLLASKI